MTDRNIIESQFCKAVEYVRTNKPTDPISKTQKLKAYGLYKQATLGDNRTKQPPAIHFIKRAKWDAWKANEGKPQLTAMIEYTEMIL